VDEIIARRKNSGTSTKRKRDANDMDGSDVDDSDVSDHGDDDEDEEDEDEDEDDFVGLEDEEGEDPLASSDEEEDEEAGALDQEEESGTEREENSDDESDEETQAEKERKAAFFASDAGPSDAHTSFLSMNLSRPILKAITSLSFQKPTPIQAATIPVALLGKDVVGNAVTGSGKTAAFIIPMLERLLYRDRAKKAAATRCLVLVPTRELGVQCFEVGTKLATYTDVRFCLAVGKFFFCNAYSCQPANTQPCRWTFCEIARSRPAKQAGCRNRNSRATY
jgi:ATP-dependent RNA helicase DDX27